MMGATEIISRDDYMSEPIKPLDKALYSAAVDTVGGDILAKIISMVSNHGVVSVVVMLVVQHLVHQFFHLY